MKRLSRKKKKGIHLNIIYVNGFLLLFAIIVIALWIVNGNFHWNELNSPIQNQSATLLSEEEKNYPLASIDGYYLGRGFLNGKGYYIFQTENNHTLSHLYILPIENTSVVTHSNSNQLLALVQVYQDTWFNPETKQTETKENTKVHYTIYLTHNQIKDYGVIEQKVNNIITFMPFFFYY